MKNKKTKKRTKKWFKIEYLYDELENSLGNVNGFEVKQLYVYSFDITSACKEQGIARNRVIDYYAVESSPAESIKLQCIKKLYDSWK